MFAVEGVENAARTSTAFPTPSTATATTTSIENYPQILRGRLIFVSNSRHSRSSSSVLHGSPADVNFVLPRRRTAVDASALSKAPAANKARIVSAL